MKKRISLRTLMILVALCAIGLTSVRMVRQYRADRVQYQSLIAHHKDMEDMRKHMAEMTDVMEDVDVLERESARALRSAEAWLASHDPARKKASPPGTTGDVMGSIAQPEHITPSESTAWFRKTLAEWTLKEAEARVAIEHWKATHFWF